VNILVTADTHVPDHAKGLPAALVPHLEWADAILHAGDLTSATVLTELEAYAPVSAVLGNMDAWDVQALNLPETLETEVEGVPVAMIHDSGQRIGREQRLARRFPEAGVIVFGHSHQPVDEVHEGVRYLNPGSPTWKRRAAAPTVARMTVERGRATVALIDIAR
jgi:putative phosphoesterase